MKTISSVEEYLNQFGIPYDSLSDEHISSLNNIISLSLAIVIIFNTPGGHGNTVDTLVDIRREAITLHDLAFPKYIEQPNYMDTQY